jgi:NAD(P)-dependent dehydrogenase (short-subunit alcohol dehydrogenase family)
LEATPRATEAEYQKLMKDREIRRSLQRIRAAGSEAFYYPCDVRDETALKELLDDLEGRFGGIDGVIHGAGVIADRYVRDKTPESFDLVFGTKVDSTRHLMRQLNPRRLKFLALFSSVASRYGNVGQADYGAANEILSKTALWLDRTWPCRVSSIAWGPWSEVGMGAGLEDHLQARGHKLIAPETGARFFIEELEFGAKGETEVCIAGGPERLVRHASSAQRSGSRDQVAADVS